VCVGDQCPMFFDDGGNPYKQEEDRVVTFFKISDATSTIPSMTLLTLLGSLFHALFIFTG